MPTNPAPRRRFQSIRKRLAQSSAAVPLPIVAALIIITALAASGATYALTDKGDSTVAVQEDELASIQAAPTLIPPPTLALPTSTATTTPTAAPMPTDTPAPPPTTEPQLAATAAPTVALAIAEPTVAATTAATSGLAGQTLPIPANGKITQPGVYSGSISSSSRDCVEVTADDVTIHSSQIGPCNGRGVYVHDVENFQLLDSTVDNNRGGACCERYTTVLARSASNVTIRGNRLMRGESLIELVSVRGAIVEGNTGRDPKGPFPRGQFLQTQGSTSNVVIVGNVYTCRPSNGCIQEDAINLFRGSNITVEGNHLDSGGGLGRSSGCGIITEGITSAVIRNNTLRNQYFGNAANPRGGCGIGVASGTNIRVEGNDVAGYGNVAYYVADFSSWSGGCSGVSVVDNVAGLGSDGDDNFWSTSNRGCSNITQRGNSWQIE